MPSASSPTASRRPRTTRQWPPPPPPPPLPLRGLRTTAERLQFPLPLSTGKEERSVSIAWALRGSRRLRKKLETHSSRRPPTHTSPCRRSLAHYSSSHRHSIALPTLKANKSQRIFTTSFCRGEVSRAAAASFFRSKAGRCKVLPGRDRVIEADK